MFHKHLTISVHLRTSKVFTYKLYGKHLFKERNALSHTHTNTNSNKHTFILHVNWNVVAMRQPLFCDMFPVPTEIENVTGQKAIFLSTKHSREQRFWNFIERCQNYIRFGWKLWRCVPINYYIGTVHGYLNEVGRHKTPSSYDKTKQLLFYKSNFFFNIFLTTDRLWIYEKQKKNFSGWTVV